MEYWKSNPNTIRREGNWQCEVKTDVDECPKCHRHIMYCRPCGVVKGVDYRAFAYWCRNDNLLFEVVQG